VTFAPAAHIEVYLIVSRRKPGPDYSAVMRGTEYRWPAPTGSDPDRVRRLFQLEDGA
jgi:hypothetical protein